MKKKTNRQRTHLFNDQFELPSVPLESVFVEIHFGVKGVDSIRGQDAVFGDVSVSLDPDGRRHVGALERHRRPDWNS